MKNQVECATPVLIGFQFFFGETPQYRNKEEKWKESQDPLTSAEAIGGRAAAAILKDISMDLSIEDEGSNGALLQLVVVVGSGRTINLVINVNFLPDSCFFTFVVQSHGQHPQKDLTRFGYRTDRSQDRKCLPRNPDKTQQQEQMPEKSRVENTTQKGRRR